MKVDAINSLATAKYVAVVAADYFLGMSALRHVAGTGHEDSADCYRCEADICKTARMAVAGRLLADTNDR